MTEIQQKQTVTPAAPGWNQVTPIVGENNRVETFTLEPVVAWLIEHGQTPNGISFAHCEPITPMDGLNTANGILQRPDGSFGEIIGGDFVNRDDVLKELQRRHDTKNER